jgi:localization factor PodJL
MSIGEWLDSAIADSAHLAVSAPTTSPPADVELVRSSPQADDRQTKQVDTRSPRPLDQELAEVKKRLEELGRQIARPAHEDAAKAPAQAEDASLRRLASEAAEINRQRDQLMASGLADSHPGSRRAMTPAAPAGPLDNALQEIAERQRALDVEDAVPRRPASPPEPHHPPISTQLELQLRQINSQIETLRCCGVEQTVEALRGDLAAIGLIVKDAMPRQAIEALEAEMHALTARIEDKRHGGADDSALARLEAGLSEVRDALRTLLPAEQIAGLDVAVQGLSQRIDHIAAGSQGPAKLQELESSISALRQFAARIASDETLAKLFDEIYRIGRKIDQIASSTEGENDILASIERQIVTLADALQSHNESGAHTSQFEAIVKEMTTHIDGLKSPGADQSTIGQIEDRIAKLIDKLDSSDSRLGNIETIEKSINRLIERLEVEPAITAPRTDAPEPAQVEALKRDVQRTQDTLEAVHGTLGQVVDRLAVIETGLRGGGTKAAEVTNFPPEDSSAPPNVARVEPGPACSEPARSDRQPIDPNLPPDYPLEPGSAHERNRSASAGERIAASEAALGTAKPASLSGTAGKSDFIAAARRAAQAAAIEAVGRPDKQSASNTQTCGTETSQGSSWRQRLRLLLVGTGLIVISFGSLHLALNYARWVPGSGEPIAAVPPRSGGSIDATETPAMPYERADAALPAAPAAPAATIEPPTLFMPGNAMPLPASASSLPAAIREAVNPQSLNAGPDQTGSISRPIPPANAFVAETTRGNASPADRLPVAIGAAGLRNAALKGDAAAAYEIGLRFAEGRLVPQNLAEAAEWFERAAKQGLVPAQFRLGGLYEKGLGVKKDPEIARRLYTAAAEAGNAKAMHNLAVLHAEGLDGRPDYQTAAKWFRKAAEHGVADSQYNLAILYARGIGVPANLAEAYKWFTIASRSGDKESAKKRDEIATRLDPQSLAAAKLTAQNWDVEPQPEEATSVKVPVGGWDEAANPVPDRRRPVAAKADQRPPRLP